MDPKEKSVSLSIQPDGNWRGFSHAKPLAKILFTHEVGDTENIF
jgi:hypothetical protein